MNPQQANLLQARSISWSAELWERENSTVWDFALYRADYKRGIVTLATTNALKAT
jgi:hypothetical protein